MEAGSKVKSAFLSGIALCIVSVLLLLIWTAGHLSGNADVGAVYLFVPLFFLATGIVSIVISRENNTKNLARRQQ